MGIAFIIIMSYNISCKDNLKLYEGILWGIHIGFRVRGVDISILSSAGRIQC